MQIYNAIQKANQKVQRAEEAVVNFCASPLTVFVGKPVPHNRSEALFRIYLTDKTRKLLSQRAKTAIEDYAWLLVTKYDRGITRADAGKL